MRLRFLLFAVIAALAAPAQATPHGPCAQAPHRPGVLTVNFLGVSTIVVAEGSSAIMVDGFFSRPRLRFRITPDPGRIADGLDRAGIARIDAEPPPSGAACLSGLFVAQAHHDHGMDAGIVANMTGATLFGSASTAQIAAGAGAGARWEPLHDRETLHRAPFSVRIIESPHSTGPIPRLVYGTIDAPLVPPRSPRAWRDTRNFSFLIAHGTRKILVHPSANVPAHGMGPIESDIVFLSIGDLHRRGRGFAETYWREIVLASGTEVVVPIHWDNFFRGIRFTPSGSAAPLSPMPLSRFASVRRWIEGFGERDCIQVRFLTPFEPRPVETLLAEARDYRRSCLAARADRAASSRAGAAERRWNFSFF